MLTPKGEHLHFPQGNVLLRTRMLPLECQLSGLLTKGGSWLLPADRAVRALVCAVTLGFTPPLPPPPRAFPSPPAGRLGKQSRFQAPHPRTSGHLAWPVLRQPTSLWVR